MRSRNMHREEEKEEKEEEEEEEERPQVRLLRLGGPPGEETTGWARRERERARGHARHG